MRNPWNGLRARTATHGAALLGRAQAALPGVAPALLLMAGAAGLLTYAALPPEPVHAAQAVEAFVLDRPLRPGADPSASALSVARAYLREPVTVHVGAWEFRETRASLGAVVDVQALELLLRDAHDDRSALRRYHAQSHGTAPLHVPLPVSLDPERAMAWARRVRDQVAQRTVDARLDTDTLTPVPEQAGLALDVMGTLDALEAALHAGTQQLEARVTRTAAARTTRDLAGRDFRAVLGSFETRYNPHDKDRAFNLRVAARHVDGLVLLPGEVFDFNAVVGERSEQNGFRPAHVIAGGEITDGVGGGTCQIAGTLYAAVYFAGLNVLERSTHTRPSAYLKLGLDATVSYPRLNLRFQNDLDQAVAISAKVDAGKVRVSLRGAGTAREVSFVRRIDAITPYGEAQRDDPSLPAGTRVLSQRGVPGFEVTSFRVIRDLDTGRIVRERHHDVYPPTQQVWRVGRGNPPGPGYKPPAHDNHGEYTADEYVILTYRGARGLSEERRNEGRSGVLGWTAREGMPQPAL